MLERQVRVVACTAVLAVAATAYGAAQRTATAHARGILYLGATLACLLACARSHIPTDPLIQGVSQLSAWRFVSRSPVLVSH